MTSRTVDDFDKRWAESLERGKALSAWHSASAEVVDCIRSVRRAGAFALITASLGVTSWACGGPTWLAVVWGACTGWSLVMAGQRAARFVRAHEAEQKANAAYEAVVGKREAS